MYIFVIQTWQVNGVAQNSNDQNGMTGSEQGLREMLNAVKEQNRKLVLQNKRLQQVNKIFSTECLEKTHTYMFYLI